MDWVVIRWFMFGCVVGGLAVMLFPWLIDVAAVLGIALVFGLMALFFVSTR
jgi:hypothetical protein